MSEPFIFIGTHTIKEGKLEDFKKSCGELLEVVEANEPRLIAFNLYVERRRDRGEYRPGPPGRGLHAVPHAGGPRAHQRGHRGAARTTERIRVYGTPNDTVLG